MDDRTRAKATAATVEAARELLQGYKAEHTGWTVDRTPVDDVVSWLGLEVETFHPNHYPQGTYGFLEHGEDLIWLCRDLSSSLHRFTLAHELGHAVLHRDGDYGKQWSRVGTSPTPTFQGVPELSREDPCQQPGVQEEGAGQSEQELWQEVLGIGQTYDPRSERERAANIFAAELLMPLERVRTLYLDQNISPNQLASNFGVSNAAMLNRLAGLLTEPARYVNDLESRPEQGDHKGSPLPWTNDVPAVHENDKDSKPRDGAEEAKPDHGRGDPLWSPGVGDGGQLWTNDAGAVHESDGEAKPGDGAEEAKPDHG